MQSRVPIPFKGYLCTKATFLQPGVYAYVNHNLIEAIELGATAHFVVEGDWSDDLMKQLEAPGPIPAQ